MKQNDILKIGTFSILCYLIFRISHYILINLLLLLNLKLQISNEIILLSSFVIISGILPIIGLTIYLQKSIFKSIIPTLKIISFLFIILVFLTFIREGIEMNLSQQMAELERGEFRSVFLNQWSWSKGVSYLFFSIILLIFYLIKLGSLKKQNLEKESEVLKIGISSVLCYLVFEKVYLILNSILTWIYTLLRIENESIILGINILFGIISILILILLYSRIIKNKIPSKKNIYILLGIGIFMILLLTGNNFLIPEYFENKTDLEFSDYKFLSQFSWSKGLNYLVEFLGLTFLIWKIYYERKNCG